MWSEPCLLLRASPHWPAWHSSLQPHGKTAAILDVPFLLLLTWPLFSVETPSLTSHYFVFHISIHFSLPVLVVVSFHAFLSLFRYLPPPLKTYTHMLNLQARRRQGQSVLRPTSYPVNRTVLGLSRHSINPCWFWIKLVHYSDTKEGRENFKMGLPFKDHLLIVYNICPFFFH